jgi:hypothetical protein
VFKEPFGGRARQIWSEVIAYELAKAVGVSVPPAFLAIDSGSHTPGVLVEFFYGHPGEFPDLTFVHAVERMQALGFPTDFHRGSLRDNIQLTRAHQIGNWDTWWAETLAFDALIGNTDRHSENWGFLSRQLPGEEPQYGLGPAFDNGTSLGFIIGDGELHRFGPGARFERFIERGSHHFGWLSGQTASAGHAELCRQFIDIFGRRSQPAANMARVAGLRDSEIERILNWCTAFDFPVPFTEARADFVYRLVRRKRDELAQAIGL